MNHKSLSIFKSTKNNLRATKKDLVNRYTNNDVTLKKLQKKLAKLQEKIQAQGKHAVLIIFQAMDAAGKDSTIRNVFRKCDIAGIDSVSFKQPSKEESAHDFIWRCHKHTPKKGGITIFNRSYYEEVLVVKVHPEWLSSQGISTPVKKSFWKNRYTSINNFEKHLQESGTTIIKFMLDVSQKEQHLRLKRRYAMPAKQWKFSTGDIKESKRWDDYQSAFDSMLSHTSNDKTPWHVIPADNKSLMRLLVTDILICELKKLKPQFPEIENFDQPELSLIDQLVSGNI